MIYVALSDNQTLSNIASDLFERGGRKDLDVAVNVNVNVDMNAVGLI